MIMKNLLVVSSTREYINDFVTQFLQDHEIPPDRVFTFNNGDTPLTIEEFRELLRLTQRYFDQLQLFVIENFETFSEIMQNTFLKTLEEHQANLGFVLITRNLTKVLPTVRSRCEIVGLKNQVPTLKTEDRQFFEALLKKLENNQTEDRQFFEALLKKLENNPQHLVSFEAGLGVKNKKEKAIAFLDRFLIFARTELPGYSKSTALSRYAKRALEMRDLIENNNLDPEMAIDQVFLS